MLEHRHPNADDANMAPRRQRLMVLGALIGASVLTAAAPSDARPFALACAGPYAYAGAAGWSPTAGVAATLTTLEPPQLAPNGQVAAWVGVGGRGLAAGGADAWIQAGFVAFGDGSTRIYYEITVPGRQPVYTEVATGIPPGAKHRFVVAQVAAERWVVLVDGRRVAGPVRLPGSRAWRPMATAESWVRGSRGCNRMAYAFADVRVRGRRSGWTSLADAALIQQAGYAVVGGRTGSFLVVTVTPKVSS
jgi:hypothetical protein